jgi:non-ribosomal peptide synthetase component F
MHNHVLNYLNRIVREKPDKVAYSNGTVSLTFQEVYTLSRGLGTFCHNKGIYKQPVVIFMQKSPEEIAAFFGVITGGNYYVPIDEEMPAGRIRLILENVKSPLLICDESTIEAAKEFEELVGETVLYSEAANTPADDGALQEIYNKAIDTDPIYIVFTSGSTGIPKGVVACHRSVIDYVEQLSEVLGFNEDTVFGNQTPLYFDACLKEIYPTLKFGATTYLIPKSHFSFPIELVKFLNEYKINTVCWVVSALTMVSSFNTFKTIKPEYLHTVAFGSEVFPIKQFRRWREALPNATFTNLYGPTETTGMCCYYRVEREFEDNEVIPIGRPFDNREILLLTQDGRLAAPGEDGEICIRGTAITLG